MADDPGVASWIDSLNEVMRRGTCTGSTPPRSDWNPFDDQAEARLDQRDLSGSDADWFADQHERGQE